MRMWLVEVKWDASCDGLTWQLDEADNPESQLGVDILSWRLAESAFDLQPSVKKTLLFATLLITFVCLCRMMNQKSSCVHAR